MTISLRTGRNLRIFLHLVAWGILFVFPIYLLYIDSSQDTFFLLRTYLQAFLYAVIFYVNYLWLVPLLFFRKRKLAYTISAVVLVVLSTILINYSSVFFPFERDGNGKFRRPPGEYPRGSAFTAPPPGDKTFQQGEKMPPPAPGSMRDLPPSGQMPPPRPEKRTPPPRPSKNWPIYNFLLISSLLTGLGLGIRFSDRMTDSEKRREEAEKEKLNTELTLLKNQINPHFLFNTLNSIYSLALTKNDLTAEAVMKLSDMMRYVIYEVQNNKVPLEKEILYINHFIELQKLRLSGNTKVHLEVEGDLTFHVISPLILIIFIENAFKYGTTNHGMASIGIRISTDPEMLRMTVINQVFAGREENGITGIGLKNVRQRLYLEYPGKHDLKMTSDGATFNVNLTMNLL